MGQTINVSTAGTYAVSFDDASPANNGGASTDYEVLLDGNVVGTYSSTSTAWAAHTTTLLTLTAGQHALEFVSLSGYAEAIDNVNLVAYQVQGSAALTGTINVTGSATLDEADGQQNITVSGNVAGSGTLSITATTPAGEAAPRATSPTKASGATAPSRRRQRGRPRRCPRRATVPSADWPPTAAPSSTASRCTRRPDTSPSRAITTGPGA